MLASGKVYVFYNRRDPVFLFSNIFSFFTRLGLVGGKSFKALGFIWVKAPRLIVDEYVDRIEEIEVKKTTHNYELDDFMIEKYAECAMALE